MPRRHLSLAAHAGMSNRHRQRRATGTEPCAPVRFEKPVRILITLTRVNRGGSASAYGGQRLRWTDPLRSLSSPAATTGTSAASRGLMSSLKFKVSAYLSVLLVAAFGVFTWSQPGPQRARAFVGARACSRPRSPTSCRMPVIDGVELLSACRADPSRHVARAAHRQPRHGGGSCGGQPCRRVEGAAQTLGQQRPAGGGARMPARA